MHELALTQSVVDTIAERMDGTTVTGVLLEIGKLSGVVPEAMRFCFDVVCVGTSLEGARLDITEPVGRARCGDCGDEFELDYPILLCPCGSANVTVLAGQELRVKSVEVL